MWKQLAKNPDLVPVVMKALWVSEYILVKFVNRADPWAWTGRSLEQEMAETGR
jgi:hypothetical protein